jgi:hypothetical protein
MRKARRSINKIRVRYLAHRIFSLCRTKLRKKRNANERLVAMLIMLSENKCGIPFLKRLELRSFMINKVWIEDVMIAII